MSSSSRRRPGRPRKRPADELRALVLTSAREVFADTGLVAATIEQIAAAAGVTRQAVYEQFEDKNALFDAALDDVLREAREFTERLDRDQDLGAPDWERRRYAGKFTFCLGYPVHVKMIREADRLRHPAALEYRCWETQRDAATLREQWSRLGYGLGSGRAPEVMAAVSASLVQSTLDLQWDGERPGVEVMAEMLAVFSAGGMRNLVKYAPDVLKGLG